MTLGPQDGKPVQDGPLGLSGNFTVVGYADADGTLLYRDDDTGNLYEDGQTLEEFGEEFLKGKERGYLDMAEGKSPPALSTRGGIVSGTLGDITRKE